MASLSDYLENEILDHILRKETYVAPDLWIALFTADDGLEAGTITSEVSGGSYARLEIDRTILKFTVASSGASDNTENWEFPEASGSWGTVAYMAIMDAVSGGNVLVHGALTVSKAIASGDVFRFKTGELDVTAA